MSELKIGNLEGAAQLFKSDRIGQTTVKEAEEVARSDAGICRGI